MSIILHTTDCPKCKVLKQKLEQKGIDFIENHYIDIKEMRNKGILSAPILQVNNNYMEFYAASE